MANKLAKQIIAMAMATTLTMGMSLTALAETIDNGDGTSTIIETITTGDAENGTTETTATIVDADGNELRVTVDKVETETIVTEDDGNEAGQPEVIVTVTPDSAQTATSLPTTDTTGDIPAGEDDTEYNYTETTTTEREVSAELTEGDTEITEGEEEIINASETDKEGVLNETHKNNGGMSDRFLDMLRGENEFGVANGPQSNFNGTQAGDIYYYETDEDGNVKVDADGNPVRMVYNPYGKGDAKYNMDIYQLLLKDAEGNYYTTYGLNADAAAEGLAYNRVDIEELEDSFAYGADTTTALNSIAKYGYWGSDEGNGSLSKMKEEMKASLVENEDGTVTIGGVTYANKEAAESVIDSFTAGDAQLVTNAALWSFTDGYADREKTNTTNKNAIFGGFAVDKSNAGSEGLQMMYEYLMGLAENDIENSGSSTEEVTSSAVIEDVTLTVYDKVADAENNLNDDSSDDVYSTDLTIQMVVTNDGKIHILNSKGEVLASADISGTGGASTTVEFKGIQLQENETIDIRLEHVECMQTGVYVCEAPDEVKEEYSYYGDLAPLIGLTQKAVTSNTSYEFTFDVNEDDKTVVTKSTRTTTTVTQNETSDEDGNNEGTTSGETSVTVTSETAPAAVAISETEVPLADAPLVELFEDEVPLADVPLTGDPVVPFMGLALLSALGLAFTGRRKKEDR